MDNFDLRDGDDFGGEYVNYGFVKDSFLEVESDLSNLNEGSCYTGEREDFLGDEHSIVGKVLPNLRDRYENTEDAVQEMMQFEQIVYERRSSFQNPRLEHSMDIPSPTDIHVTTNEDTSQFDLGGFDDTFFFHHQENSEDILNDFISVSSNIPQNSLLENTRNISHIQTSPEEDVDTPRDLMKELKERSRRILTFPKFRKFCCLRGHEVPVDLLTIQHSNLKNRNTNHVGFVTGYKKGSQINYGWYIKSPKRNFIWGNLRHKFRYGRWSAEKKYVILFPKSSFSKTELTTLGIQEPQLGCNKISVRQCKYSKNDDDEDEPFKMSDSCWKWVGNQNEVVKCKKHKDFVKLVIECDIWRKKDYLAELRKRGVHTYFYLFHMYLELDTRWICFNLPIKTDVMKKKKEGIPYHVYQMEKIPFNFFVRSKGNNL